MDCLTSINTGDSALIFPTIFGGIPPINYSWSPSNLLSNPTDYSAWASPIVNTTYIVTLTDSVGCQGSSNCYIFIDPLMVEEIVHNKHLLKIVDILGKESSPNKKGLLFYIYDDGTVEKRIIIK